ncbi:MAG: hypothetical protein M1828_004744 [Chrysothrix sp. TS-e1954]|nr:MAG: hypothetical protein M1828_004744 [Chrysothrix sp. TS-e1954]
MRRRPAEDNSQMLTRLLSLAAAATAASLMGDRNDTAMNNLRNAAEAVDGDDGTFDGFLQALRSGRLAQHLGQNDNAATSDGDQTPRNPASLDFFRMFRFGSGDRRRNADSSSPTSDNNRPFSESTSGTGQGEDNMGENGNRMIPILIVGIRSLNSTGEGGGDPSDAMPSFLDALTNLPATTNIGLSNQGPLQNFRQARGLRSDRRRRASMGGLNLFPGDHHDHEPLGRRNLSGRPRPQSEIIEGSTGSSTPTGPYPPPTTPLSPPLSVPSTGTSTPSRRASLNFPSAGSSTSAPGHPNSHTPSRTNRSSTLDPTAEEPSPLTSPRRRMSDSTHHFRRRSRDSRRYGLVGAPAFEGDNRVSNSDSPTQATEGNRSWIIYVLGGSYPENHPILTTPSLFTDSPTYEDMLLLSSLLGPAKPPVANAEDVASAGGLLTIVAEDGRLFAQAVENEIERLPIIPGENCLVCLSPYVAGETARRLKTCAHLFHRECIDQWLTTGRNSCPLCRSQGVSESETTKSAATGPDPESPGEGPSARPASMAI